VPALVLAYTTAYVVTALPLPAGGAGGIEAGVAFSLNAVGIALGLGGAIAATRLVSPLLYAVSPRDPLTFAGVAAALAATALAAAALPARRAARLDPSRSLRQE